MSDFDDDLFGGGDGGDDGDSEGSPSPQAGDPKSAEKRIRDLQSAADKAVARANKAEQELERLKKGAAGSGAGAASGGETRITGAEAQGISIVLDMARDFALQRNPKLAEYGVTASDLTGSTPAEIAAAATALVARYEKIETQARNKVLAEHGLAPEVGAAAAPKQPRDFSSMPKEDFDKLVSGLLGGQPMR